MISGELGVTIRVRTEVSFIASLCAKTSKSWTTKPAANLYDKSDKDEWDDEHHATSTGIVELPIEGCNPSFNKMCTGYHRAERLVSQALSIETQGTAHRCGQSNCSIPALHVMRNCFDA
jgi:hypothetical protein